VLRLRGQKIIGIIDNGRPNSELPLLGDDQQLSSLSRSTLLVMGIGGARLPTRRQELFDRAKFLGFSFLTVVHPSAIIAADVAVGEGAQVMAGAVVQTGTRLGANVIVNSRATIDHDSRIGDHAHIAPGAALAGGVVVGTGSLIGTGASAVPGVKIGSGTLVGAGAAVVRDLPDGVVAIGVPCRVSKRASRAKAGTSLSLGIPSRARLGAFRVRCLRATWVWCCGNPSHPRTTRSISYTRGGGDR
jgi:UDP-perosamine 4-acetyltransferase